ncbi:hypothetical protein ANCDUO_26485 [Ancylostoma duodenale]|uniref:Uncharacterized protein n=1 Tax=Ancylostoma duodenale TaxID=51022 RepID=A0A0C2BIA8_9BILA|nr:hypothetical protein ANCDUO_26485 [Ancylostoma duodenale]
MQCKTGWMCYPEARNKESLWLVCSTTGRSSQSLMSAPQPSALTSRAPCTRSAVRWASRYSLYRTVSHYGCITSTSSTWTVGVPTNSRRSTTTRRCLVLEREYPYR